jgi:predicted kinase
MNKLIILIGPPGSGKSSHAKTMEASGYLRISQDDQGREGHRELFETHVCTGKDIVVDRMNFDKAQRDRYRLEAIKNGYEVSFVEFVVPRQLCYDRCMAREGHPTINGKARKLDIRMKPFGSEYINADHKSIDANNALNLYFSRYEEVTDEEGEVLRIQYNASSKTDAIMVDLDGTLCNLDHRLHYVKGEGKKDWGRFFKACGDDAVYEDVAKLVETEILQGTNIVLCSGRPADYQEHTEKWLARNEIVYTSLKMRPKLNYKRDDITKAMLYRYEIKPFYNIKYVLDDRQQVVDKWRSMGLSCFQVRPGDF